MFYGFTFNSKGDYEEPIKLREETEAFDWFVSERDKHHKILLVDPYKYAIAKAVGGYIQYP